MKFAQKAQSRAVLVLTCIMIGIPTLSQLSINRTNWDFFESMEIYDLLLTSNLQRCLSPFDCHLSLYCSNTVAAVVASHTWLTDPHPILTPT